jgi:hypothetical protein
VITSTATSCTPTLLDLFRQEAERERLLDLPLTFGKHKGRPVRRVPVGYARWALDSVALLADLRRAMELRVREYDQKRRT